MPHASLQEGRKFGVANVLGNGHVHDAWPCVSGSLHANVGSDVGDHKECRVHLETSCLSSDRSFVWCEDNWHIGSTPRKLILMCIKTTIRNRVFDIKSIVLDLDIMRTQTWHPFTIFPLSINNDFIWIKFHVVGEDWIAKYVLCDL